MPIATLPTLSRRAFGLTLAGAGLSLLRSQEPELHWALLSDTHISGDPEGGYRGFKTQEMFKKALPGILGCGAQGALVCGDVARLQGLPEDYAAVKKLMAPVMEKMPLALICGNHDHRENLLKEFGGSQPGLQGLKGRNTLLVETPMVRLIALDSLVQPNSTPGFLGKAQRTWLETVLKETSELPTLVFVHHTLDDEDGSLLDAPRLFDVLRPHKKVKAIVYGHSHSYNYAMWEGVHLINLPSLGYNFKDNEPVGWVECRLTGKAGSFTLHTVAGDGSKNGKTTVLPWRA